MFSGLSTLRKAEKKEPTKQDKALQDYLKRQYGGGTTEDEPKKKKKKKSKQGPSAIAIVDGDITGLAPVSEATAKPIRPDLDEAGDSEGDEPVIANPEEAEALRQQIEKSKNFYAKSKDGSGWEAAGADEPEQQRRQQRQQHDSPAGSSDRDLSPPRRQRHDTPPRGHSNGVAGGKRSNRSRSRSPDSSPPRRARVRHDSPDPSPPRRGAAAAAGGRGARGGSPDMSPPRRQRHDSEDLSPPRRPAAAAAAGDDLSPPRRGRQRHDSPDLSPPRKPAASAGAAAAASRGRSPDLSPPRRGKQRHDSPDLSPPRKPAAAGGRGRSPDLSLPRRNGRQRHDSPQDASPPRRARHDSPARNDLSPPRRRRHDSPDRDMSPPRRGRDGGSSASAAAAAAAAVGGARDGDHGGRSQQRMTDGTAAGLVSSKDLAEEAARLRVQAEERKRRAAGRGEATVYRDKETGAIISADEYAEQVAKSRRKREPPEEIHVAWKGGLAQQRAAVEAAQRAASEAGKAFGRSFDDEADADMRGRDRWGDPMAGKLSKKKLGDGFDLPPPVITEANQAMMEASGFNVPQEVPPHSWLRRKVPAPVNRYNIRPGRHWDGVDRSNGFEKEMFRMLNQRNAQELEARMWAQEDM